MDKFQTWQRRFLFIQKNKPVQLANFSTYSDGIRDKREMLFCNIFAILFHVNALIVY